MASPVMGASTSSMHFSWRRMAAPSLMIFRAASSSRRPSLTRWAFRISTLGLPSTYRSLTVRRVPGGYGTPAEKKNSREREREGKEMMSAALNTHTHARTHAESGV